MPRVPFARTTMMLSSSGPEAATRLLSYINASPTPYHAVHNAALNLEKAGFAKIRERDDWEKNVKPGGKYYFTRNQAALLAFTIPQKWKQGAGVSIIATHVDSPNLRLRPVSKKTNQGYLQVGVETYGSGLWHTWFDRDLSLAGRVVVADKQSGFTSKLIKIEKPLLRIPTLAIHLDRDSAANFKFNTESEFIPILGLVSSQLNATKAEEKSSEQKEENHDATNIQKHHHSSLLSVLAEELSIQPEEIHDFELQLYDTQPAQFGGLNNEFMFSPRLDNQYSSFCAVEAISTFASDSSFSTFEGNVNCIALFNHEEIGSVSTSGAESSLIPTLLQRLSPTPTLLAQSIAKSFLLSCDVSHAVHPNYASKHEENHRPALNGGIVFKTNAKQRYTSDAITTFLARKLVEKKGGRAQEYEVRNDMACGSTVGPMLSKLGLRTVDIGCPILSMHSIRETGGSQDVQSCIDIFSSLFESFAEIDANLVVD